MLNRSHEERRLRRQDISRATRVASSRARARGTPARAMRVSMHQIEKYMPRGCHYKLKTKLRALPSTPVFPSCRSPTHALCTFIFSLLFTFFSILVLRPDVLLRVPRCCCSSFPAPSSTSRFLDILATLRSRRLKRFLHAFRLF